MALVGYSGPWGTLKQNKTEAENLVSIAFLVFLCAFRLVIQIGIARSEKKLTKNF
jgi:hypothetical protein